MADGIKPVIVGASLRFLGPFQLIQPGIRQYPAMMVMLLVTLLMAVIIVKRGGKVAVKLHRLSGTCADLTDTRSANNDNGSF